MSIITAPAKIEIGRSGLEATLAKSLQDPISTNKLGMVVHPCNPSYVECINRRTEVLINLGKNIRPYLKMK
jgi:hypothetical protein